MQWLSSKPSVPFIASAVAASFVSVILLWHLTRRKKVYMRVGRVKKLLFYPVKSLSATEVEELQCTNTGVEVNGLVDRSFMLIKDDGEMVTRTNEPSLVFVTASVKGNDLVISGGDMKSLKIPINDNISPDRKVVSCRIIADTVKGVDCGDDAAKWFQTYLNRPDVRLVRCSSKLEKRIQGGPKEKGTKDIFFQNKEPMHVMSVSSIEELNKALEKPISEMNFRPNVLIEGCLPYSEDDWQFITFPDGTEIQNVGPCGRCALTTVDPATGVKTNKEPLSTLRKFRVLKDTKAAKEMDYRPCFGILCGVKNPGTIRVGDEVFAVTKKGQYEFVLKS